MLHSSLLLMKSLNKTKTSFSVCNLFFVSKGNLLDFYLMKHRNSCQLSKHSMACAGIMISSIPSYFYWLFFDHNCPFNFLLVVFWLWCRSFKCVILSHHCLVRKVLGNCIDSWSLPSLLLACWPLWWNLFGKPYYIQAKETTTNFWTST